MNYLKIDSCDLNNGEGVRVTLWVAGCDLHCNGCHNYESWNFDSGNKFENKDLEKILKLLNESHIKGLSILGGEPLHKKNINKIVEICNIVRKENPTKDIWIWTGYKIEELELLPNCDILIDGKFDISKPTTKKFRGSDNQRMFYIKNSLVSKMVD